MVDDAFEAMGSFVQPVWEVTYMSTALALVRAGLGVTILPGLVLAMDGGRQLQAQPIRVPGLERQIGIIQATGRSLSPAAEVLFQAVCAGCRHMGPGRMGKAAQWLVDDTEPAGAGRPKTNDWIEGFPAQAGAARKRTHEARSRG
jgi:hypothetical protein